MFEGWDFDLDEETKFTTGDPHGGNLRKVHIVAGKTYQVVPQNPRAVKNRGRICTVIGIIPHLSKHNHAGKAVVRFHDTNREGKANCDELFEVDGIEIRNG
ncbi:MAG: hypothetical protein JWP89_5459 [Schlesneria sp.]|nr:hypothetical protein [Schlesneria sp.]